MRRTLVALVLLAALADAQVITTFGNCRGSRSVPSS